MICLIFKEKSSRIHLCRVKKSNITFQSAAPFVGVFYQGMNSSFADIQSAEVPFLT